MEFGTVDYNEMLVPLNYLDKFPRRLGLCAGDFAKFDLCLCRRLVERCAYIVLQ